MSKFDRCIFISIAIGIWALAMTQVFKPSSVNAGMDCSSTPSEPCYVALVKLETKNWQTSGVKDVDGTQNTLEHIQFAEHFLLLSMVQQKIYDHVS